MKPIKMTQEYNDSLMESLRAQILNTKTNNGKININIDLNALVKPTDAKEINIIFSAVTFIKYTSLVQHNTEEVGWHGIVERISDTNFLISDIVVYPQVVSGASVTPDQVKYQLWLYEFDDDTFKKIRFHGHSHVNMATFPSGVDSNFRMEILDQLTEDDYYIFSIHNKKGDREINLYDMKTNWIYETADINVSVLLNDQTTKEFIAESDKLVTKIVNSYHNIHGFTADENYNISLRQRLGQLDSDDSTHLLSKKEEKELKKYLNKPNRKQYDPEKEAREYVKKHGKLNS